MSTYTLTIRDTATPFIERLRDPAHAESLRHIIGNSARNTIQRHVFDLNRARHRSELGNKQFYAGAARATTYAVDGESVNIIIPWQGFAQRYHGGTIRPVKAKALAIPTRRALGQRPGDFPDGELFIPKGRNFLARRVGQNRIEVMFTLHKAVTQQQDHSVIPDDARMTSVVRRSVNSWLARLEGS